VLKVADGTVVVKQTRGHFAVVDQGCVKGDGLNGHDGEAPEEKARRMAGWLLRGLRKNETTIINPDQRSRR
jgi:hypothetical protein